VHFGTAGFAEALLFFSSFTLLLALFTVGVGGFFLLVGLARFVKRMGEGRR
jgi:hypothetical protein